MNTSDYSIKRLSGLTWGVRNNKTGDMVSFSEGRYSSTAKLEKGTDISQFNELMKDDSLSWLAECFLPARLSLLARLDDDTLTEVIYKLHGMVAPQDADEYAFPEDLYPMLEPMTDKLREVAHWFTNDEITELYHFVNAYYLDVPDTDEWMAAMNVWFKEASKDYARKEIGSRIRELREAEGISHDELAKRAGITTANIRNIEAGRYSVGIDVLYLVARGLDCSITLTKDY